MNIHGKPYQTVWVEGDDVVILDQRLLPWRVQLERLRTVAELAHAIRDMAVRGAGCIGVTAGYGMWLAVRESKGDLQRLRELADQLSATRPTAVNLTWAVERVWRSVKDRPAGERTTVAIAEARQIAAEDLAACQAIGQHGLGLIRAIAERKPGQVVNVLTHCNAGWLGFVDYGSATAPIYAAQAAGVPVHVWVDETRPRNQGARLTAWELGQQGVPHTLIADNTGGHLMQHGLVDLVITGADRVTATGDVANKIGTYLKALAARDNGLPFYVALPSSTIDWAMRDGLREIPIEQRNAEEVTHMEGMAEDGSVRTIRIAPEGTSAANYGFDVTPARLVTAIITEHGVFAPKMLKPVG